MLQNGLLAFALVLGIFCASSKADIPVNCSFDSILGSWTIYEGERGSTHDIRCDQITDLSSFTHKKQVKLDFPFLATDEREIRGTWTIVYNQGFEVNIDNRRYFAFSNYTNTSMPNVTISHCGLTQPGWSHDILARDWSCYYAVKQAANDEKLHLQRQKWLVVCERATSSFLSKPMIDDWFLDQQYQTDSEMIEKINKKQTSWKAVAYPELEKLTMREMQRRNGGYNTRYIKPLLQRNSKRTVSKTNARIDVPDSFDWRNVNGQNFVSAVRNQGNCGSCFAFASMGMLESRLRIYTNNTNQQVFSVQDTLECTKYDQACDGGFPYLIAGKYAEDFGVVPESENPYDPARLQTDPSCHTSSTARRYYATSYNYLGHFYGGGNEDLMKEAVAFHGPVVVGVMVYPDFVHYKSGVYQHTGIKNRRINRFNPYEALNHAVLVIGYGFDEDSQLPYWIVKNSWGADWGENGYIRILRGKDEVGIESLPFESFPIPTY